MQYTDWQREERCARNAAIAAESDSVSIRRVGLHHRRFIRDMMRLYPQNPEWGRCYLIACGLIKLGITL